MPNIVSQEQFASPKEIAVPSARPESRPDFSLEALAGALPRQAAVIGLDVGTKTIGVAISDVTRTVATAVKTIRRRKFSADAAELSPSPRSAAPPASSSACPSISTAPKARAPNPAGPLPAISPR